MIPKIIHYCWLSDEEFPELIRLCMDSWKRKLPDYHIKCWNTKNFDINYIKFVKEACENKQWAAASDYIRLYALYTEGGIYLDSDVFIKKELDSFLDNKAFSCVEYNEDYYPDALAGNFIDESGNLLKEDKIAIPGLQIQAAVVGSVKGNPYIKDCMSYYESRPFVLPDGSFDNAKIVAPDVLAYYARNYGFRYTDKLQNLDAITIYPSEVFARYPSVETKDSYAIHYCNGSWRDKPLKRKIIDYIRKNIFLRLKKK